jgi:hypothetical protein
LLFCYSVGSKIHPKRRVVHVFTYTMPKLLIKKTKSSIHSGDTNLPDTNEIKGSINIMRLYSAALGSSAGAGASVAPADCSLGASAWAAGAEVSASDEVHRVRLSRRSCMIRVESL